MGSLRKFPSLYEPRRIDAAPTPLDRAARDAVAERVLIEICLPYVLACERRAEWPRSFKHSDFADSGFAEMA